MEGNGAAGTRTEFNNAEIIGTVAGLVTAANSSAAKLTSGMRVYSLAIMRQLVSWLTDASRLANLIIVAKLFAQLKSQWEETPGLVSKDPVKDR